MKVCQRIQVYGKVQGVYYRASTVEKAVSLGLTGWVRNMPDGSVLIEAEGDEEQVQKLIEWAHSGPSQAVVDKVEVEELSLKNYEDFDFRR